MQDHDQNNKFYDLIASYLSGNTDDAGVEELEKWVLASPENKMQFMAFKKAWLLSGMQQASSSVDVQATWKDTAAKLFPTPKIADSTIQPLRRPWLRIAAAIALLVITSFVIQQFLKSPKILSFQTTTEIKTVDLPDGSKVTLGRFSSLAFDADGSTNIRSVILTGNAFFEVIKDEKKPFRIQSQGIEINVLGTSFLVDSRENSDRVQVMVESGSVAVRSAKDETILQPGEQAVFQKSTAQISKNAIADPNYVSLKTGRLIFEKNKLEEVVFAINRQFHSNITIESQEIKNCEITGIYNTRSLDTLIMVLEKTMGIEAKKTEGVIVLSGTNCK